MTQIISIHSFRGGTGKSNSTANLATLLAIQGARVGVIDTDIQSPGIHVLFGLHGDAITNSLNDYLWGRCAIHEAAYNVTDRITGHITDHITNCIGDAGQGQLFLIPSSIQTDEIVSVLREGFDITRLTNGYRTLIDELALDYLLIDTHPGLNEETLFSLAISQVMLIIMRPDQQDYEGTGVTVAVARSLDVPRLLLLVNKTPTSFDPIAVQKRVEETYDCEVAAVLPHSDEMMVLASSGLFVLNYPEHPLTELYKTVANRLIA